MTTRTAILLAFILAAAAAPAVAEPSFKAEGYIDVRALRGPQDESWFDGGLGKLRWSEEDDLARHD